MNDRVSLTYAQATAILDRLCELEAQHIHARIPWLRLTPEARSGLELLRAAKDEERRLARQP